MAETVAKHAPRVAASPKELAKLARLEPDKQRQVVATIAAKDPGPDGRPVETVTQALAESDIAPPPTGDQACQVLRQLIEDAAACWRKKCGATTTAALGASVLEATAIDWLAGAWGTSTKTRKRKGVSV